jgi:hypothetical protein
MQFLDPLARARTVGSRRQAGHQPGPECQAHAEDHKGNHDHQSHSEHCLLHVSRARPPRPRAGQLYRRAHRPRGRRGSFSRFYVEGQAKTLAWMTLEATAEPIALPVGVSRDTRSQR